MLVQQLDGRDVDMVMLLCQCIYNRQLLLYLPTNRCNHAVLRVMPLEALNRIEWKDTGFIYLRPDGNLKVSLYR